MNKPAQQKHFFIIFNGKSFIVVLLRYFIAIIVSVISIHCYSQSIQIPGLISCLPLNGNLNDQSGNGNNAQEYNTTFTSDRFGNPNSALYFNNSYLKLSPLILGGNPSDSAHVFRGDFTISFWGKSSKYGRSYALSIDPTDGNDYNLNFELNDQIFDIPVGVYVYWNSGGYPNQIVNEPYGQYTDDQWHHFLLRRTAFPNKVEVFIDTILVGSNLDSTRQTIGSDTSTIYFGKDSLPYYDLSTYYWIGKLDDIMIFNRAITETEIHTVYSNGIIASMPLNEEFKDEIGGNKLVLLNTTGDSSDLPSHTTSRFNCSGASYFNGNGYLKLEAFNKNPLLPELNYFDKDFTISFWIKSNQAGLPMYAFSIDDTTNTNNLHIKFNAGSGCEVSWNGSGNKIIFGTMGQYTDNQWHQIVIRRSVLQSSMELLIDNVLVGSQTESAVSIGSNFTDIIIGHFNNEGWVGSLDDFIFYSRYLDSNEIYKLYNTSAPVIDLKYPKLNDSWASGSQHNITWNSNFSGFVDIEYSSDSINWIGIAEKVEVSYEKINKYLWDVPNLPGSSNYIRIKKSGSGCMWLGSKFNIVSSQESSCYEWTNITMDPPFEPRDGAGALVFDSTMWLLGGWNPLNPQGFFNTTTNEVWKSIDGLNWTQVKQAIDIDPSDPAPVMWESRHTAGYVVYKDEMWILGGDPIHNHYQNDVWKSKDGYTWERVATDVPWRDRVLHYTLVHDDKIWVIGGQTLPTFAGGNLIYYNDVWSSTDGINWISYPNAPWLGRGSVMGSVVFNNRMWILGGGTYEGVYYNDVWSSADGISWTEHVDYAPWEGCEYHNIIVFDGKMWIIGGMVVGVNSNKVWYSSDGVNWYELPDSPWIPRHAASVYDYNNELWVVAGNVLIPGTLTMIADVWKLTCHNVLNVISTSADELEISIYPNPSEDFLKVQVKNSKISQINVKDILGRTIFSKIMDQASDIIEVNTSELKTGLYIIECIDENGLLRSKKFVRH